MGLSPEYDDDHGAGEEGGLTMVIHEAALARQMKAAYKDDVILIEDGLYKQGLFSRAFIMPGRDEKHQRELDHLGKIFWVE